VRVLLITQGISRLVNPLFSTRHDIVGVVESMPRGFDENKKSSLLLNFLKLVYLSVKGRSINLRSFCEKNNVPYNYISKGRDKEIFNWVKNLNPDLIVVLSMSQLIKKELINLPRFGVINMHPSYLPEYRGANPDFWQYYNMEMNPGVTIHYIDEGEDTGDIIYQKRVHIPLGTKSPERLDKLVTETGVPLMLKAIDAIENNTAPRIPQLSLSPTERSRNLKLEEHKSIIDWERWPIERVWHVLRGTELWLNAFEQPKGFYKGQRWVVGDFERSVNGNKPGSIVSYKGKTAVSTPEGYIFISKNFNFKKLIISQLSK
jgi:methionyl-tRNA formyltransferase